MNLSIFDKFQRIIEKLQRHMLLHVLKYLVKEKDSFSEKVTIKQRS